MAMSSIRQLRRRTQPMADDAAPYRSGGPDDPALLTADPLGIGATARGMYAARSGDWPLLGPLPDPRWVGFFQTLKERNAAIGPGVGERGSRVPETGIDTSGTAGDALADVADSMSGQPGSIEALRRAARPAAASPQVGRPGGADGTGLNRSTAPPRDPTIQGRTRVLAGMRPGSLAALQRRLFSATDDGA